MGFFLDDDESRKLGGYAAFGMREVAKAASYTVLPTDNGTRFTTLGAVGAIVFTLPALAPGLRFQFLNLVAQDMTITSAAGNDIFVFNDLAASSIAFTTSMEEIGANVIVYSNEAGTAWYVDQLCKNALTVS
jgi:hypothetical protein